jgi:amino acid transporter
MSLAVPVGAFAGFFFILPICFTLPPLEDIIAAPAAQALPFIFHMVMGSPGGGMGLTSLVLAITLFCSISISVAASRCTWAMARDNALPGAKIFARVNQKLGVPVYAIILMTVVQMLLGLINLGSTSAFTAFVSVGVQALALSYAIPIAISLFSGRKHVSTAPWKMPSLVGKVVNIIALVWIAFEVVLFSMPTALPVTEVTMNYASVVLVGFMAIAAIWYVAHARKGKLHYSRLKS